MLFRLFGQPPFAVPCSLPSLFQFLCHLLFHGLVETIPMSFTHSRKHLSTCHVPGMVRDSWNRAMSKTLLSWCLHSGLLLGKGNILGQQTWLPDTQRSLLVPWGRKMNRMVGQSVTRTEGPLSPGSRKALQRWHSNRHLKIDEAVMPRCGAIYVPAETASTRALRWRWVVLVSGTERRLKRLAGGWTKEESGRQAKCYPVRFYK